MPPRDPTRKLTRKQILEWADLYYDRTGRWPHQRSGPVRSPGTTGWETWSAINEALRLGRCGLPGGHSLHQLLSETRGKVKGKSSLTITQILKWVDAHKLRTGRWPGQKSGPVRGAPGESWMTIDKALRDGYRGLEPGSSLPWLLAQHRGLPHREFPPRLTIKQILAWADEFKRRTGRWPTQTSGPVRGQADITWYRIHEALYRGQRGLKGGSSLAKVLDQYRRKRSANRKSADQEPAGKARKK